MLHKLKVLYQSILAKAGHIKDQVHTYIAMAIAFGQKLQETLKNPITELTIAAFVPAEYQHLVPQIQAIIAQAIGYLTQSTEVLNAGTPDQIFTAFVKTLQDDVPGLQKTKIMKLLQKIVSLLDGNSLFSSVYDLLVQKYYTAHKLGAGTEE